MHSHRPGADAGAARGAGPGAGHPAQRPAKQEVRAAEERALRGIRLGAALRAAAPRLPLLLRRRRRRLRRDHPRRARRLGGGAQRQARPPRRPRRRGRRRGPRRDAAGAHAREPALLVLRPLRHPQRLVADQAGVAGAPPPRLRQPPRRRGRAHPRPLQVRGRARAQGAQVHQQGRGRQGVGGRRGALRQARPERTPPPLQVRPVHRDAGAGVRRRAVRRPGAPPQHLRRHHQQGGAARVLGPNLRHQLRRPPPDLLRHGGQGRGRQDHRGGGQRDHHAKRVGEQAVEGPGAVGGVRAADHGGAGPGQPGVHRALQPGDAAAAGAQPVGAHRHDQQPQPEPDAEPEPPADAGAEPAPAVVPARGLLPGGQLAARVGDAPVALHLRGALRLEVRPVPPPLRVRGDGLLRVRRQGRRRDSQVQHGAHPAPRLPEHHHLDPQPHRRGARGPLRRQPQLPQGGRRGDHRRRRAPHHLPPDLRLPAAAPRHRRRVRAARALLRRAAPAQLLVVRQGHRGVDGAGDAGAHGGGVHAGDAVVPARAAAAARPAPAADGVQRILVLAPLLRSGVRAADRARALPVPDEEVAEEVDVDVPGGAHGAVRVRAADPGTALQRAPRADPQGGRVPRQRPVAALLQAAGVPVQERAVHLRQLRRRLAVPVAPVLHHVGAAGRLRERAHQDAGGLDARAQERLLEGVPAAGGGQERAAPGRVRPRRRRHDQPQLPEGADRRALRRAGAGLQAVRRGAARRPGHRRHAHDLHHQGHHQQHEDARRRPGGRRRQHQRRLRVRGLLPHEPGLLLLGHPGAGLLRVVPRRHGRGGRDRQEGRHRAPQLLHQRLRGGGRPLRPHRHAPVAQPRQARRRRRLRHPRQDPLRQAQLAQRLQAHRPQPPRPARRSVLLRCPGADQGAA
ncbi:uncharacterized protein LOC112902155 isoform X2 [Panicum hallii]|uniref:uncharacterized protein LOC112902155 isoform X2 n=1 Tax=Panicum hallii TaxID=206008 RepID=UPI000DF4E18B|nr:uncharacterized protein LOC112902155 isoform X2 [Panicum hallii]